MRRPPLRRTNLAILDKNHPHVRNALALHARALMRLSSLGWPKPP
jgi:hypothetical protein